MTLLTHPAIHHQIGKPLAHRVLADYLHDQLHVLVVHLQHNMERATEHIDHSLDSYVHNVGHLGLQGK